MPRDSRRVLIVEDDADCAEAMHAFLAVAGYEVATVHDARAALAVASARPPDIVLLDLGLPGVDGFDVARQLRGMRGGVDSRIIAMSGYGDATTREGAMRAGCDHFVLKPSDPDDVLALVAAPAPAPVILNGVLVTADTGTAFECVAEGRRFLLAPNHLLPGTTIGKAGDRGRLVLPHWLAREIGVLPESERSAS
jgi:CheY-like chemotaxis protein